MKHLWRVLWSACKTHCHVWSHMCDLTCAHFRSLLPCLPFPQAYKHRHLPPPERVDDFLSEASEDYVVFCQTEMMSLEVRTERRRQDDPSFSTSAATKCDCAQKFSGLTPWLMGISIRVVTCHSSPVEPEQQLLGPAGRYVSDHTGACPWMWQSHLAALPFLLFSKLTCAFFNIKPTQPLSPKSLRHIILSSVFTNTQAYLNFLKHDFRTTSNSLNRASSSVVQNRKSLNDD